MDLQVHFYEHMLPDVPYQFQLTTDTYQMLFEKFKEKTLSQIC